MTIRGRCINLWRKLTAILVVCASVSAAVGHSGADPGDELAQHVLEIFAHKCSPCHSPDAAARLPKAIKKWADNSDLEALRRAYVEPQYRNVEKAEFSALWLILTDDSDDRMPPQKSKSGPLSQDQLQTVLQWIQSGSPVVAGPAGQGSVIGPAAESQSMDPALHERGNALPFMWRLARWVGKFHPAVVHLPIGLIAAAAVAELFLWLGGKKTWLEGARRYCLLLGALTGVIAAGVGWLAGIFHSPSDWTLFFHRWIALAGVCVAVAAAVVCEKEQRAPSEPRTLLLRALIFTSAGLIAIGGHLGGVLVHGPDHYTW